MDQRVVAGAKHSFQVKPEFTLPLLEDQTHWQTLEYRGRGRRAMRDHYNQTHCITRVGNTVWVGNARNGHSGFIVLLADIIFASALSTPSHPFHTIHSLVSRLTSCHLSHIYLITLFKLTSLLLPHSGYLAIPPSDHTPHLPLATMYQCTLPSPIASYHLTP